MRTNIVIIIALFCAVSSSLLRAAPLPDTPENRHREAARYLRVMPPKEILADGVEKVAMNLPLEERQKFKEKLTSALDLDAVTKAMTDALVKHFTAEEIAALADFYGSPVGKSILSKFGTYMAEMMPVIDEEMTKAEAKANQSAPN